LGPSVRIKLGLVSRDGAKIVTFTVFGAEESSCAGFFWTLFIVFKTGAASNTHVFSLLLIAEFSVGPGVCTVIISDGLGGKMLCGTVPVVAGFVPSFTL
jgi:hypothetical protein